MHCVNANGDKNFDFEKCKNGYFGAFLHFLKFSIFLIKFYKNRVFRKSKRLGLLPLTGRTELQMVSFESYRSELLEYIDLKFE